MTYTGVFGSAFNPPTHGHLDVLIQASLICHRILLVPSFAHPFQKTMLDFSTRLHLTQQFIHDAQRYLDIPITLSNIEEKIERTHPNHPVYTFDVLTTLQKSTMPLPLLFIRGPDNARPETWNRFYRCHDIERTWDIFTAHARTNIRSTLVRKSLYNPHTRKEGHWKAYLSPRVSAYIMEANLYTNLYKGDPLEYQR